MPNWCNNTLELHHDDPKMIVRAFNAIQDDRFFSEFVPCPQELSETVSGFHGKGTPEQADLERKQKENIEKYGYADWYSWSCANWGTKWEICEPFCNGHDENYLTMSFDTAWSPPIAFYEKMKDLGFVVRAFYYEPGMAFCGNWDDGDDNYYEITGNSEWVEQNIPTDIDCEFGISEGMAMFEEEADYTNQEK